MAQHERKKKPSGPARVFARILMLVWASFWVVFGFAAGLGEELDVIGIIMHLAVPGLFFLAAALISLKWELVGSILLLIEGLLLLIGYPILTSGRSGVTALIFILLLSAVPPIVAGAILLYGLKKRNTKA